MNREKIKNLGIDAKAGNMRKGIVLLIAGLSTAAFNIGFNSSMPLIKIVGADGITIHNANMVVGIIRSID